LLASVAAASHAAHDQNLEVVPDAHQCESQLADLGEDGGELVLSSDEPLDAAIELALGGGSGGSLLRGDALARLAERLLGGADQERAGVRATIHHTVTPTKDSLTPPQRLRQIQRFHQVSRGWCDIGYNYLVSRDGRVWRGRGATTVGAHVSNSNTGNIGISFMGTYITTAPTETQMCQAAKLLRRLHEDFGGVSLNRTDVKGHRQFGGTSCPGDALMARIDKILRKARNGCAAD